MGSTHLHFHRLQEPQVETILVLPARSNADSTEGHFGVRDLEVRGLQRQGHVQIATGVTGEVKCKKCMNCSLLFDPECDSTQ